MSKADYEALAEFRSTLRRFLRTTDANARAVGLTPQQHQLLLAIKGQRGRDWSSVGMLAASLQITHHATVGLVDRCARAELVRRDLDLEDRRQVRVSLTPRGEDLLERLAVQNRSELQALKRALALSFLEDDARSGPGPGAPRAVPAGRA